MARLEEQEAEIARIQAMLGGKALGEKAPERLSLDSIAQKAADGMADIMYLEEQATVLPQEWIALRESGDMTRINALLRKVSSLLNGVDVTRAAINALLTSFSAGDERIVKYTSALNRTTAPKDVLIDLEEDIEVWIGQNQAKV